MKTFTKEMQDAVTPVKAIELLKEGNRRFLEKSEFERDLLKQASETTAGQFPFATILSCIDSRASAELIFDQGIGDIFSIRIAGNVLNDDIIGSMEFACKVAGSKLIVVLGHTHCGAVKGACDHVELGSLTGLLDKIQPAIEKETTETKRNSSNPSFVKKVIDLNVKEVSSLIGEKSPILREMIESGEIGVIGGVHDIATGEVKFFE